MATDRKTFGVLAVALAGENLPLAQRDLLEAFARQAALVLDRIELRTATEQARLLAESERLSRALLNSISHELRTPLAASTSAASALADANDGPREHRRILVGEIQEANARLNRIVSNLLDVARLESGKVVPRLDWYDARDLVQTTIRELQRELANHPVELNIPSEPLLARFDFSLVQHALGNLLMNAATHTPPGTAVEVRVQFAEGSVVLSVADRGLGIASELLPRIFDKFFRAPNAPTAAADLASPSRKDLLKHRAGRLLLPIDLVVVLSFRCGCRKAKRLRHLNNL